MLFSVQGVFASDWRDREAVQATLGGDYYAAGRNIELTGDVEGDAFAAGCPVLIESRVKGDAALAGCSVTLRGKVGHDVYAAGGTLLLDSEIAGNARVASGRISLAREAAIAGRATLAGRHVALSGSVGPYLTVFANSVRLDGEVRGDAEVTARRIELGPGARITGKLVYRSGEEARIDPAAEITGGVTRLAWNEGMARPAARMGVIALAAGALVFLLGLMLTGAVLVLLFPKFMQGAAGTITSDPGKSLALGLALLATVPFAAMLLMMSVIGIPLAVVIFLLYPLALLLGYLTAAHYIGERGARRLRGDKVMTRGGQILSLLLALLALAVIALVPLLGVLVLLIALLAGLGAVMLHGYRLYARATVQQPQQQWRENYPLQRRGKANINNGHERHHVRIGPGLFQIDIDDLAVDRVTQTESRVCQPAP